MEESTRILWVKYDLFHYILFSKKVWCIKAKATRIQRAMVRNINLISPVLSSILVFESTDDLDLPGRGGLSGTIVGTAMAPAVMLTMSHSEIRTDILAATHINVALKHMAGPRSAIGRAPDS